MAVQDDTELDQAQSLIGRTDLKRGESKCLAYLPRWLRHFRVSHLNTMPDVIDALKRLERVGSENSKTTEKLINAATELSKKIVEQFHVSGNETVTVLNRQNRLVPSPSGGKMKRVEYEPEMYYLIEKKRLKNGRSNLFVDECRDSALGFSKDVAAGLLDHIVDELTKREADSRESLSVLETAAEKIRADQATARASEREIPAKGVRRVLGNG